jgi:phosphoribosyl-AMP cyclohydrolase / phosphoribosyl-ATP pyrophosphohydrolase
MIELSALNFEKGGGMITVVAQDASTGAVLMLAHADREAVELTISTGEMHYRSRTRGLWRKGDTSGNVQRVVSLHADCDGDALLAIVDPAGPACHEGTVTCFNADFPVEDSLVALDRTILQRAGEADADEASTDKAGTDAAPGPAGGTQPARRSYTQRLLADRNLRMKKLGEEAAELVTACADGDRERAVAEAADLFYHTLVALRAVGAGLGEVSEELARRARPKL